MPLDFTWIDDYFQRVKPYIFVRLEDNLLIKRPNQVQKLNKTGAQILKSLLNGIKIKDILQKKQCTPEKELQIHQFLTAIRESIDGNIDIFSTNPAVEKKPFEMNFSEFPVLSEIAITYKCNLSCAFCYAGCNLTQNPVNSDKELTTSELKKIIHKIYHQAKVPSISFTGGEPTLRKDLAELIKYAKGLGMRVNLISNGTLIDKKKAHELSVAGLDSSQISVEGIDSHTHDHLVGRQGAFDKAMAALRFLKEEGIHTHTNTTLNRFNIEQAPQFPAFVKNQLAHKKFSMNMMIPSGSVSGNESLKLTYSEMGEHIQKIIAESKVQEVEFMWYSPIPICMFNTITHGLGNKGCAACDGLLSVAANGDILPCSSYDQSVGNLLNDDFNYIWHNEKASFFHRKDFAHRYCKACEHFMLCNGACPLYWRNMGCDELDNIIRNNLK